MAGIAVASHLRIEHLMPERAEGLFHVTSIVIGMALDAGIFRKPFVERLPTGFFRKRNPPGILYSDDFRFVATDALHRGDSAEWLVAGKTIVLEHLMGSRQRTRIDQIARKGHSQDNDDRNKNDESVHLPHRVISGLARQVTLFSETDSSMNMVQGSFNESE